jgi:dsDNA-specific endonuclease/ATPase MutS2
MKSLDSVIRFQEWKLEEKRRKVSDLERLAQSLHDKIARLDLEMRAEQKAASENLLVANAYDNYANEILHRRQKLLRSLADIEVEMTKAMNEVAAAYGEFKKLDLMRNRDRERTEYLERRHKHGMPEDTGRGRPFRKNSR